VSGESSRSKDQDLPGLSPHGATGASGLGVVARAGEGERSYALESGLVEDLVRYLSGEISPWGQLALVREFFYQRGRTDLVGVSEGGTVVAFEAKLTRWRVALRQACRNRCFAHRSFVVLPPDAANLARKYRSDFERMRVGLCTVNGPELVVIYDSPEDMPFQPWLNQKIVKIVNRAAEMRWGAADA
jgi:hypothetical protein